MAQDKTMEQPGLQGLHCNKDGEVGRKHGQARVGTLRKIYGPHFATEFGDGVTLREVLQDLDEPSLSRLVHDHEHRQLPAKIAAATE